MHLTICIPTLNEELNISKCLKSVKWAKKVIILDSGSKDNTIKIIKKFKNTKVIKCSTKYSYVDKLNYLIRICKSSWILILDADFVVSKELSNEIKNLNLAKYEKNLIFGFKAKIYNKIFNKVINEDIFPQKIFLFKKNNVKFKKYGHCEKILFNKKTALLNNCIYHENLKDIKKLYEWKKNQKIYAQEDAKRILKENFLNLKLKDKIRCFPPINLLFAFLYYIFLKKILFYQKAGLFYLYQRLFYELEFSKCIINLKYLRIRLLLT